MHRQLLCLVLILLASLASVQAAERSFRITTDVEGGQVQGPCTLDQYKSCLYACDQSPMKGDLMRSPDCTVTENEGADCTCHAVDLDVKPGAPNSPPPVRDTGTDTGRVPSHATPGQRRDPSERRTRRDLFLSDEDVMSLSPDKAVALDLLQRMTEATEGTWLETIKVNDQLASLYRLLQEKQGHIGFFSLTD